MMRSLLACLLLMLGTLQLSARTSGFGVTAGMNIAKLNWKHLDRLEPQPEKGWYLGITGMVKLPLMGFGLDASVLYQMEQLDSGLGEIPAQTDMAHSFTVPIHVRYDFEIIGLEEIIVPYAFIGPQMVYALNDLKFSDIIEEGSDVIVRKENSWRIDMGVGVILLDHLQLHYSYAAPMGRSMRCYDEEGEFLGKCKARTHKLSLTYFF
ncbi:MAG: outer membrane beta-barrel protein [Bacteroidales bacterium]|nr:outer membrane beta-barrel protein [Bacteroidales bacterium]